MKRYIKSSKDIIPEFLTDEEYKLFMDDVTYQENLFKNNFSSDINNYFNEKILEYDTTTQTKDFYDYDPEFLPGSSLTKYIYLNFNCFLDIGQEVKERLKPEDYTDHVSSTGQHWAWEPVTLYTALYIEKSSNQSPLKFVIELYPVTHSDKPFVAVDYSEIDKSYDNIVNKSIKFIEELSI